ncbi:MAG: hypothetical protein OXM61_10850 [Candidatus Poribacteria bacterium]|nr:hypothetical protein [Candidatus Poribacteria bacterium]
MICVKNLIISSLLTPVFTLLCLTGCGGRHSEFMDSAQANYRAKDYNAALRDTVTALQYNPNYEKAQTYVKAFFDTAVRVHQDRINILEKTSDRFKWDQLVVEYEGLIEVNSLVGSLPPLTHKKTLQPITFDIKDYTAQFNEVLEKAAEAHYQEGIRLAESSNDPDIQKRAAKEFKIVEEFIVGYKDAQTRYEQAKSAGVKRIAILTFEDKSGKRRSYGAISETITDNIISSILNDPEATEFLKIVSRNHLEQIIAEQDLNFVGLLDRRTVASLGKVLGVHEIVVGQITQIIYIPPDIKRTTLNRERTENKKTGTEKYVDKNGKTKTRPKYSDATVTAKLLHYKLESSVSIIGSYKILDAQTAELKKADNFDTKHEFISEWASFTGNEEALTRDDHILVSRDREKAPIQEVMVLDAANKLAGELAEALKAYVR